MTLDDHGCQKSWFHFGMIEGSHQRFALVITVPRVALALVYHSP